MRFVSIPMIINMIVAILTVKLKNVGGLDDFAELDEPLFMLSADHRSMVGYVAGSLFH